MENLNFSLFLGVAHGDVTTPQRICKPGIGSLRFAMHSLSPHIDNFLGKGKINLLLRVLFARACSALWSVDLPCAREDGHARVRGNPGSTTKAAGMTTGDTSPAV
jgi:hypothetical protein